jgi:hypothetical protein
MAEHVPGDASSSFGGRHLGIVVAKQRRSEEERALGFIPRCEAQKVGQASVYISLQQRF